MTFANYIDWNVMRMTGFSVWLSMNPAAALRIKGKEMKLKVEKPSVSPEKAAEYERDLEETKRRQPIREPMVRLNIGTAMLLVLPLSLYICWLCLYARGLRHEIRFLPGFFCFS